MWLTTPPRQFPLISFKYSSILRLWLRFLSKPQVKNLFPGSLALGYTVWVNIFDLENFGDRLHPFLASLPIGVLLLAFGLVLFAIAKNAEFSAVKGLVLIATALVGAAYISGDLGREGASKTFTVDPDLIAVHQAWGKVLLTTLLVATGVLILEANAVVGRRWLRLLVGALIFLALSLCVMTGAKGGELVFIYGAGVVAACPSCGG